MRHALAVGVHEAEVVLRCRVVERGQRARDAQRIGIVAPAVGGVGVGQQIVQSGSVLLLGFAQLRQRVVLHRVRLVLYRVELLPMGHMRLVGDDGRGVRHQAHARRAQAVGGSFEVLGAAGAVFDIIHGQVLVRSGRRVRCPNGLIFDDFRGIFGICLRCCNSFYCME